MGLFDKMFSAGGKRRLTLELGREISLLELRGDREIETAGRARPEGLVGAELGNWLRGWIESLNVKATRTRVVLVDGDIEHHLVTLPEMSDGERHLAVGAEVRKLASAPSQQIDYSHMKVGQIERGGVTRDRILVSVVDRATVRNAADAIAAAGLELDTITTVPPSLIGAVGDPTGLPDATAMVWLSSDRCYLVVINQGMVELVRDFRLGAVADAADTIDTLANELRRSFLFFAQKAHGGTVRQLLLAGPMPGIERLVEPLAGALDVDTDLLDTAGYADVGDLLGTEGAVAVAAGFGSGRIKGSQQANLISPEQRIEGTFRRYFSVGSVAAGVLLVLLIGWGLLAFLSARVQEQQLVQAQERLQQRNADAQAARVTAAARQEHAARRALLESSALESLLIGTAMHRIGRNMTDPIAIHTLAFRRTAGPDGGGLWDAQFQGFVFGVSRSESQAVFNGFYGRLASEPIVDTMSLVEPLIIGAADAREPSIVVSAARGDLDLRRDGRFYAPEEWRARAERQRGGTRAPGQTEVRTTLDDLPPFAPTESSVTFNVAIRFKAIATGGQR